MRAPILLFAILVAGCTPRAVPLPSGHPARPDAPIGRLAGPPAALRSGVAAESLSPPAPPEPGTGAGGHGAHGGNQPPPDDPPKDPPKAPPTGHEGHQKDRP